MGHYSITGGGRGAGLFIPAKFQHVGLGDAWRKMIRPASPGLEIYYLFHKGPVRGLILKYPPPRRLNGA